MSEASVDTKPEDRQEILSLKVQYTEEGRKEHNVLSRPRHLRIKIVDIRSGAPLAGRPVEELEIDGEPVTMDVGDDLLDISKFGYLPKGTWKLADIAQALKALGYDPEIDSPGKWADLYPAIRLYREDFYAESGKEESPVKGSAFRQRWRKRIIDEYRRAFFATVQHHLGILKFKCVEKDEDKGVWDRKSVRQFRRWQTIHLNRPRKSLRKLPISDEDLHSLITASTTYRTNERGVMAIPIPAAKIKAGFDVKLSVIGSPLIMELAEGPIRPAEHGPTGFLIEQGGEQKPDDGLGDWGWRVRSSEDRRKVDALPQLSKFVAFKVPAAPDRNWKEVADRDGAPFHSRYPYQNDAEVLIFALVWCQPIWDGFENPAPGQRVNENAYLQGPRPPISNMHIVTMYRDLGGSDNFGGKGYGVYERRPAQRWRGKKLKPKAMLLRLKALGYFDAVKADIGSLVIGSGLKKTMRAAGENYLAVSELDGDELAKTYAQEVENSISGPVRTQIKAYQKAKGFSESGTLNKATRDALEEDLPRSAAYDKAQGHQGYDLHVNAGNKDIGGSETGSPVYAVHGGVVKRAVPAWKGKGAAGNYIRIGWTGTGHNEATYLHLDELLLKPGDRVRAGQIIGYGGNTGNFGKQQKKGRWATISEFPSHTHLNVGLNNGLYRNGPEDDDNRACLPNNFTPLLLPCKTEVPLEKANPAKCRFGGEEFRSGPRLCWTVAELRCPHMPTPEMGMFSSAASAEDRLKQRQALQAQLRYLFLTSGGLYEDPGPVDGDIGAIPKSADKVSATRKAIRAFRAAHGMLVEPDSPKNYSVDEKLLAEINMRAPIRVHGFERKPPDGDLDRGY